MGGADAERAIMAAAGAGGEPGARRVAVNSLGRIGTPDANRQLETLAKDEDTGIARTAFYALARSSPEGAARIATQTMASDDSAAKLTAIQLSGQLDQDSMRRVLLAGVKDSDPNVLNASAQALAQIGGPEAQSALGDILTAPDSPDASRRSAAEALESMGGDATQRYAAEIAKYKDAPSEDDQGGDPNADDGFDGDARE